MNLFNQISTVLCGPKDNDSEDIKSALHELIKLVRSWDKQMVSPMLKVILPDVLAQLRHNEVGDKSVPVYRIDMLSLHSSLNNVI